MAVTSHSIKDLDTDPANNGPVGSDAPSVIDNSIRALAAALRDVMDFDTIASASTCDIGSLDATLLDVTGTTAITSLGTVSRGIWKVLFFSGSLTLTFNGTSLITQTGASVTTAAGDLGLAFSLGSGNWRVYLIRASGQTVASSALFLDGTVGAPGIGWVSDTDTGFYRSGANSMVAVANGAAQATFNASGLSATAATFTTMTATNAVATTVRSPDVGSSSGALTLTTATDSINFNPAGNTTKLQSDGEQFAFIETGSDHFVSLSIPGAVGGAEPYQFGVGVHPSGAAATGAWSDVFFTAIKGARVGASSAVNDVLTVYAQNATVNAIYVLKDGPNAIFRVDKDGATFADGAYSSSGADYAECFLPHDPADPPQPRQPVVLVGDRVRAATPADAPDDVVGVVSERPSVIGDMGILTQGGIPVGLVGKLRVIAGLPVHPSWRHLGDDLYLVR